MSKGRVLDAEKDLNRSDLPTYLGRRHTSTLTLTLDKGIAAKTPPTTDQPS